MVSTCPARACSSLAVVLLLAGATAAASTAGCSEARSLRTDPDDSLDRLLRSYRPGVDPAETARRLSDDRLAVLRAVVWAGRMPLTRRGGGPAGPYPRLVDYITGVEGIWGVRPGETEGRQQFRLSVLLAPSLISALVRSEEFDESGFCHVISGDDDPNSKAKPGSVTAGRCFRGVASPSVQVSFAKESAPGRDMTGEIDIDYDPWTLIDWGRCHGRPSNSDVRAWNSNRDHHLVEFDAAFSTFGGPLNLSCTLRRFHCEESYADRACP